MAKSLAIKYRPKTWDDVTEQFAVISILSNQIRTREFQHAYLFCGSAGTGKTTCARIFANEINKGNGNPIEMDAASKNGVDDVREIIQNAKLKPLDGEYKVFIIDECHAFSNNAWQAMLKIIEEPPAKSIFIFCTTDPQKIPKTIISRVQRYDFKRISQKGIVSRLCWILDSEGYNDIDKFVDTEPLEYIAKIADGGMRDAITLLDKCLAYSSDLTIENVVKVLGTVDYDTMFRLTDYIIDGESAEMIRIIEALHSMGKDLKQFVKSYVQFLLDVNKYGVGCEWKYLQMPKLKEYETAIDNLCGDYEFSVCQKLLDTMLKLNADVKYSSTPKYDIEATLMVEMQKNAMEEKDGN